AGGRGGCSCGGRPACGRGGSSRRRRRAGRGGRRARGGERAVEIEIVVHGSLSPGGLQCDELHINKASPGWQVTPKPAKKFIAEPSRGRRSRDLQQSCECAVSGRLQSGPALVWSAASRPGVAVLSFVISDLTQTRPGAGVAIDEDTHRQQQSSAVG